MKRWLLYHHLTILDVLRLWPTVQHHVIIVAGICLPILLLLGLKNGHVADLREELLRSPTGRQVVFWSGQHGELMSPSTIRQYEEDIPGVDLIIPEVQRLVSISAGDDEENSLTIDDVTLYSTRPRDPILGQHAADVLDGSESGIVLVRRVAEALKVKPGQSVSVTVRRQRDGVAESASTSLTLKVVVEQTQKEGGDVGYVDVGLLAAMEQYVLGFQVPRLGWPALKASAPDEYTSYLIFCETASPLTIEDIRTFRDRGYVVEEIQQKNLRTLFGLLKPESLDKLLVYRLAAHGIKGWQTLNIAPGEITHFTEADDVAIPWNDPKLMDVAGGTHRLVGLSLPKRTWLKLYMKQRECGFDYDADTFSVQFPEVGHPITGPAKLKFADGKGISLRVATLPEVQTAPEGELPPGVPSDQAAATASGDNGTPLETRLPDLDEKQKASIADIASLLKGNGNKDSDAQGDPRQTGNTGSGGDKDDDLPESGTAEGGRELAPQPPQEAPFHPEERQDNSKKPVEEKPAPPVAAPDNATPEQNDYGSSE